VIDKLTTEKLETKEKTATSPKDVTFTQTAIEEDDYSRNQPTRQYGWTIAATAR
jgi:hypothetical protein